MRVYVLSRFSRVHVFVTLWTVALQAPLSLVFSRLLYPWYSPGKNTGVGCHVLLQGIFLTQGSNLGQLYLLHLHVGFFTTNASWEAPRSREGLENDCGEEKGREAESHQPGPPCCIHSASILSFTQMKKLSSPTLLRHQVSQTALSWKKDLRTVTFSPGT